MTTDGRGNVIHIARHRVAPDNRPPWSDVAGIGVFRIRPNASFDPHFHDFHEYWLIYEGKGKISIETEIHYVQAGDVVCTPAGSVHDIVEVYEELEAFYFEDSPSPSGRLGHRHRSEQDAKGHPVPIVPLPEDFPRASRAGVFGA